MSGAVGTGSGSRAPISSSMRMSFSTIRTLNVAVPTTCQGLGPVSDASSHTPARSTPTALIDTWNPTFVVSWNGENWMSASNDAPPDTPNPSTSASRANAAPNWTVFEVSAK